MKNTCNVGYNKNDKLAKRNLLGWVTIYLSDYLSDDIKEQELKLQFIETYFPKIGNVKINLKFTEDDEDLTLFVRDIQDCVYNYDIENEAEALKRNKFLEIVLTSFLDEQSIEGVSTSSNKDMEEESVLLVIPIEQAAREVYGNINGTLRLYVESIFYNDFRSLLVVDPALAKIHNYNVTQTNALISKYKLNKFKSILNYLKSIYKDDSKLKDIKNMYVLGDLSLDNYSYVLNKFKEYLKSEKDLNARLNKEFEKILNLDHVQYQTEKYKELVLKVRSNSELNIWFENRYVSADAQNKASNILYKGDIFSSYYSTIVEKLKSSFENGLYLDIKDEVLELIKNIEYPNDNLLSYVNDYFILTQLDHLIKTKFSEYLKIEKNFIIGNEPIKLNNTKYKLIQNTKHQKSGWNTLNDEGSEKHTSTTVKDLLETIYIYDYTNPSKLIPQTLTLAALNQAWLALISDFLYNNTGFKYAVDSENKLKNAIYNMPEDVFGSITDIFNILFSASKGKDSSMLADTIVRMKELNNNHLNILYSYYVQVVQHTNNEKDSYLAKETATKDIYKKSNHGQYSRFAQITSDLMAVLYRNVNNKYLDCDVRTGTISIKSTYNSDSDFFNVLEIILGKTKLQQLHRDPNGFIDMYNFKSNQDVVEVTIKDKSGKDYKVGFNIQNKAYGIFTQSSLIESSTSLEHIPLLLKLSKINLVEFKIKFLNKLDLTNEEFLLENLLKLFDSLLNLNLLTEEGIDTLLHFKQYYIKPSDNYLKHLLHLSLRSLEATQQHILAKNKGLSLKEYLSSGSTYAGMYTDSLANPKQFRFATLGKSIFFNISNSSDKILHNLVKSNKIIRGETSKSTSRTKQGTTVSNYSVSRAGSTAAWRIKLQSNLKKSAASKLLFVKNPTILNADPISDSEFTAPTGDVINVSECSPVELIQHAIVDKFYTLFINSHLILFLPTVYSDKTQFLNYLASLSIFTAKENVLNVERNYTSEFLRLYKETFFDAHGVILANVLEKLEKLCEFEGVLIGDNKVEEINEFLKYRNKESLSDLIFRYNQVNPTNKIELELDKDYRCDIKGCRINEILVHYSRLSDNQERINEFLQELLDLFISDLEYYQASFKVFNSEKDLNSWISGNKLSSKNHWIRILSSADILELNSLSREKFAQRWIDKSGKLKFKDSEGNVNPLLRNYFYIEGLYSNNLRLSLTGTECNHPDKSSDVMFNKLQTLILIYNESLLEDPSKLEVKELKSLILESKAFEQTINNADGTIITINEVTTDLINAIVEAFSDKTLYNLYVKNPTTNILKFFNYVYNKSMINIINTAQGTQYKRNVIVTATSQKMITGLTHGVSNKVIACVIEEMKAPVNSLRKSKNIDSQDGSARMSPIQVILENNSLGDLRVGVNRKPIWDDQTSDLSSFLAKFAAFGITNAEMIESKRSDASLYNIFKKMHSLNWSENEINLTHNIYDTKVGTSTAQSRVDTEFHFLNCILEELRLYYKDAFDNIVEITNFGKDDKGYFTVELISGYKATKVYHYFDSDSNHYTQKVDGKELHNILNLFELFTALGGIYCVDVKGNQSEFSLQVLTNFVINCGLYKSNPNDISKKYAARNVVQPLKDKFIGYAFNTTAVKNGAKNVNPSARWKDNKALNTFVLDIRGLGIQLNADHDVVKGEMTEFSLVIAACAAYGKYFNSTNELYYSLGLYAREASLRELLDIENYLEGKFKDPEKAKYDLYKLIGKLLIQAQSNNPNDLTTQIKLYVQQILTNDKDYAGNELKLPFSDMSLYQLFITSITSVINNKSIKRKHPGLGYVMAPSYNTIQYFLLAVNGEYRKYMYSDIRSKAKKDFENELRTLIINSKNDTTKYSTLAVQYWNLQMLLDYIGKYKQVNSALSQISAYLKNLSVLDLNNKKGIISDLSAFNEHIISVFLLKLQDNEIYRDKNWFMPTDVVLITYKDGTKEILDLSDMQTYQNFINTEYDFRTRFLLCVTKPNNLKPSLIRWRYDKKYSINSDLIEQTEEYNKPWKTEETDPDKIPVNKAFRFVIKSDSEKDALKRRGFEIVYDQEKGYHSIHFKTLKEGETFNPNEPLITEEEKIELFKAVANAIPIGEYLSTYGNLTKDGISDLENLVNFGFEQVGTKVVKDGEDNDITIPVYKKVGQYMNIYSHPIIKNTWNLDKSLRPKLAQILEVLDLLELGSFSMDNITYSIIKGSLENTEAELVLGNMYKEEFGVGNRSLASIIDEGENFFAKLAEVPEIPKGFYHMAFVDSSNNHVLISLDKILKDSNDISDVKSLVLNPFELEQLELDPVSNEIYYLGLKIGKYVINNKWRVKAINGNDVVLDLNDNVISKDKYKLSKEDETTTVLERIDYILRYNYLYNQMLNGEPQTAIYTLYKIADVSDVARSFDLEYINLENLVNLGKATEELLKKYNNLRHDANNQIATVLSHIYDKGKFDDIRINAFHPNIKQDEKLRLRISNILAKFGSLEEIVKDDEGKKSILVKNLEDLDTFERYIVDVRNLLLESEFDISKYNSKVRNYYTRINNPRKRYTSFLNSLYFISSRIPALSLQSFMPMKCVGWTRDTNNTAYVSHILIFLLGSDYDIDKAYIMGQSFNGGIYVGWSNLFDYSTNKTLQASKTLPLPRKMKLRKSENVKYNIDKQLDAIIAEIDLADKIKLLSDLIYTLHENNGLYNYSEDSKKAQIIKLIEKHENYKISRDIKEMAYKNVASANIFNIVHGIRNRDLAYSDITLQDLSVLADDSPKGLRTKALNTMNPMAKYIMLYQNLVGKDVIGIAANGEKVWFNLTYYYHNILRNGNDKDKTYLITNHKYSRIRGRSLGNPTVYLFKFIPDIGQVNAQLRTKLKEAFALEDNFGFDDQYVDLMISQLLSAATDNAKELILAKINAGSNLAKYHLHLLMMGLSINDIVAFMISPAVELIDKFTISDLYNVHKRKDYEAINMLMGSFDLSKLLKDQIEIDPEDLIDMWESEAEYLADIDPDEYASTTEDLYFWARNSFESDFIKSKATSFKQFLEYYFRAKIGYYKEFKPDKDGNFNDLSKEVIDGIKTLENWQFKEGDNFSVNQLFAEIDLIIKAIKDAKIVDLTDLYADLKLYKDLALEVNETTSFATSWLKSNQGIPLTDEELIAYIKKLKDSVYIREKAMGLKRLVPINSRFKYLKLNNTSLQEITKLLYLANFGNTNTELGQYIETVINKIKENNPGLEDNYIKGILKDAIRYDLFGNFDLFKFLRNDLVEIPIEESSVHYNTRKGNSVEYRELAADYYNLIKSSWNILDIVIKSPVYKLNIDLLNYTLTARETFSLKAQILNELTELPEIKGKRLTNRLYKQTLSYVDKLMVILHMFSLSKPINLSNITESLIYNNTYDLVKANLLHLNSIVGLDSLKYWVENYFLNWLKNKYPESTLVKELVIAQNRGKDVLRTVLDLSNTLASILSKQTYNAYLVDMETFSLEDFDENYKISDILVLYNLIVNGTKLGGKYLTATFKNLVKPGLLQYEYYKKLGDSDYNNNFDYLVPTREDFLIHIAPTVYSTAAMKFRDEPYIKLFSLTHGFDIYERVGPGKYDKISKDMLDFLYDNVVNADIEERMYNYSRSLNIFPELYKLSRIDVLDLLESKDDKIAHLVSFLNSYSREGKVLIYKIC